MLATQVLLNIQQTTQQHKMAIVYGMKVSDARLCNGHISEALVHACRMDTFPKVDSESSRPMDVSRMGTFLGHGWRASE